MKRILPLMLIVLFASAALRAQASPAAPQDICQIKGVVVSVNKRHEQAMGNDVIYTDIEINVERRKLYQAEQDNSSTTCADVEKPTVMTYQLKSEHERPEAGARIQALTNFAGDEFRAGNWLYQIETIR